MALEVEAAQFMTAGAKRCNPRGRRLVIRVHRPLLQSCIGQTWDALSTLCGGDDADFQAWAISEDDLAPEGFAYLRVGRKGSVHDGGWTLYSQGWI